MLSLAIIGRPNVGKSTLFNLMAGKQLAIINDTPGLTRDWREAEAQLFDDKIRIIDTAGLEESFDDSIQGRMRQQTEAALKEADIILFLIDGRAGVTPLDEHFAGWLRKQKQPIILGINKCESEKAATAAIAESYSLGFGDPVILSAAHGHGLDMIHDALKPYIAEHQADDPEEDEEKQEDFVDNLDELEGNEEFDFAAIVEEIDETKPIKLAIVGRPNAGKSTLLNALVGEQRAMTGPEAGITRDSIAVQWTYKDRNFRLVDTAGLRKKAKITDAIEKMSTAESLRAIRLAQVVILVTDPEELLKRQDLAIAQHVLSEGRALVIALNKWDTITDHREILDEFEYRLETSLAQVPNIRYVTISALNGKNLDRLMDEVLTTYDLWNARISTSPLNRWLKAMESAHPPPLTQGRPNRLRYMTQIKTRPPTFVVWVSRPKDIPDSYRRYIMNGLRNDFNVPGIPVRLLVRTSKNPYT